MNEEKKVNLDTENQEVEEQLVSKEAYEGQKKRAEKAELEKKELQQKIESLQNSRQLNQIIDIDDPDLKEIIEGYEGQVDPGFIKRLLDKTRQPSKEISSELQEIKAKLKQDEFEKTFDKVLAKALEENPEYQGIVNESVIKKLVLDPSNKDKTVAEIIEETYGQVTISKKSLETTRKNVDVDDLSDFSDLGDNPEKLAKIKANPESYKKYKNYLIQQSRNL